MATEESLECEITYAGVDDFLQAQLGIDERFARAALGLLGVETDWWTAQNLKARFPDLSRADCQHIERQSPRQVLAQIEAKRRLLEIHRLVREVWTEDIGPTDEPYLDPQLMAGAEFHEGCVTCHDVGCGNIAPDGPCETLKALAMPYAGRPGYLDAWRTE